MRFLAQNNARKHWDEYPKAVEAVLKSTASQLYQQLDDLWKLAGVQGNVRKLIPNSSDRQDGVVKTLGLAWDSKDGTLAISSLQCSSTILLTKWNVPKRIAFRSPWTCQSFCHRG